jgi:hypothetical protein
VAAFEDVAERGEVGVDAALDGLYGEWSEQRGSRADSDVGMERDDRLRAVGG